MSAVFKESLKHGKVAESKIATWLRSRGGTVLPVYEIEHSRGKGPQVFTPAKELVAPDMLLFNLSRDADKIMFIEAKHKSVFTWHRVSKQWTTGIDLRHYFDYLEVQQQTRIPVWVLFLHRDDVPDVKDLKFQCPKNCPVGLFGNSMNYLFRHENHRAPYFDPNRNGMNGHGTSGMVYWAEKKLRLLASLDEVNNASSSFGISF